MHKSFVANVENQMPVDTQAKVSFDICAPVSDPTAYRSLARAFQYLTFTKGLPSLSTSSPRGCPPQSFGLVSKSAVAIVSAGGGGGVCVFGGGGVRV
jgi:hypothetical protein